jgi:hypothetical protein
LYWGLRLRAQDGDLAGLTDERTIAQLAGIRYSHNSRGQVVIESKEDARKRGVRSPDRAEAVMLAFAETKLVFGFIEYLRSLQQALDAEQSAARSGTQDASGLDGGGHHPPCPDCGSIATARVSIEWRCNQCGRQFGGQPNAVLRISRHEVLDRFWRN